MKSKHRKNHCFFIMTYTAGVGVVYFSGTTVYCSSTGQGSGLRNLNIYDLGRENRLRRDSK